MNNLCIIQARMGSSRLPGKMLMRLGEFTVIEYLLKRLVRSKKIDKIVVATTDQKTDDSLVDLLQKNKVEFFRGSENDVLDRYYQSALGFPEFDTIIRITGDCPLMDPEIVDQVISFFENGDYDYVNNVDPEPTFPDGMDVEVFSRNALIQAAVNATKKSDREHVTLYIRNNELFKKGFVSSDIDYSGYRLTLDEPLDLEVIRHLVNNLPPDSNFKDYLEFLDANPEYQKNNIIRRNEGLEISLKNDLI
ncbi:MAG: glycosyltransferase family protein [Patescibacteria group bacterium]|nr:glycosyltransferase family protein [Patescibacteria group bacterium]